MKSTKHLKGVRKNGILYLPEKEEEIKYEYRYITHDPNRRRGIYKKKLVKDDE